MLKLIDVDDSVLNNINYGGKTEKYGVTYNNECYLMKLSKDNDLSVYSECLASNFIRSLHINCQEVYLGIIPGIDLDLHLDEYVRSFEPYIVEERTLDDDRPDLPKRLKKLGMRWNDKFEYMCRTHGICGNNPIRIERIVR